MKHKTNGSNSALKIILASIITCFAFLILGLVPVFADIDLSKPTSTQTEQVAEAAATDITMKQDWFGAISYYTEPPTGGTKQVPSSKSYVRSITFKSGEPTDEEKGIWSYTNIAQYPGSFSGLKVYWEKTSPYSSYFNAYIFNETGGNILAPQTSSNLFDGFGALSSINFNRLLDTSGTTNMNKMFYGCSGLASLDLSSFDTQNVTNMSEMFYGCISLKTLTLGSSFKTSKVTTMQSMFYNCQVLTSIDTSSFDTSEVTTMKLMFYNCNMLTSIDTSSFDTSNVTDMYGMFFNCSKLNCAIPASNLDTSKVTIFSRMFKGCSSLTSGNLKLEHLSPSKATTMRAMFEGCEALTYFTVPSSWSTLDLTDVSKMFYGCSGLTNVNITNLDGGAIKTSSTYEYELPTSTLNTYYSTGVTQLFQNCTALSTATGLGVLDNPKVTNASEMFRGCSTLVDTGSVEKLSGFLATDSTYTDTEKFNLIHITNLSSFIASTNTKYIDSLASFPINNVRIMSGLFSYCRALTNINGLTTLLTKASSTYDISYMFAGCAGLTSILEQPAQTLNIRSSISNMSYIFQGCTNINNLLELGYYNFNSATSLTDLKGMFSSCNFPTLYGFSKLKLPSRITDLSYFFNNCKYLYSLSDDTLPTGSFFDTDYVENMSYMFGNCTSLTSLSGIGNFNFSALTDACHMFERTRLTTLNYLDDIDFSKVTDISYMFAGSSLETLENSNLSEGETYNMNKVSTMSYIFEGCTSLTTMKGLSKFDTSSALKYTTSMFRQTALEYIDNNEIGALDTSGVFYMSNMFYNCENLIGTDDNLSLKLDTSSARYMDNMFGRNYDASSSLESLDLSGFDTSNVTNMSSMFSGCSQLTTLNILSFNTQNVTNMSSMFYNCPNLTALNLPATFTTSNVSNFSYMFYLCSKIQSLDLSKFQFDKATNLTNMITLMGGLREIYIPYTTTARNNAPTLSLPSSVKWWDTSKTNNTSSTSITTVSYASKIQPSVRIARGATITYTLNSGTNHDDNPFVYYYSAGAQSIVIKDPTRANYKLDYWTFSGGSTVTFDNTTKTISIPAKALENITLTATWKYATPSISLDANGGEIWDTVTETYVAVLVIERNVGDTYGELPEPIRTGFTFEGWFKENTFVTEIEAGDTIDSNEDHTLYAKWEIITLTVTFEVNNPTLGSVTVTSTTIDWGTTIQPYSSSSLLLGDLATGTLVNTNIEDITSTGYTAKFSHWEKDGEKLESGFSIEDNVTITAIFVKEANTYIISFDPNGGTLSNNFTFEVTFGEAYPVESFPSATKEGYSSAGWFNGTTEIVSGSLVTTIGDHTLKMEWTPNDVTITFTSDENGTVSQTTGITVEYGSSFTTDKANGTLTIGGIVVTATPDSDPGYTITFSNWTVAGVELAATVIVNGNMEIQANFTKVAIEYTITFNANGGTPSQSTKKVVFKTEYGTLPTATRTGYTLDGWYSDNNTFANKIESTTILNTAGDQTLYAKWNINFYTITLLISGEDGYGKYGEFNPAQPDPISKEYNTSISTSGNIITIGSDTIEAKINNTSGYTTQFTNWTLGGSVLTSTTLTEDITIFAVFNRNANQYKVTFDAEPGTCSESERTVTFDSPYGTLPGATRTGFNFNGWKMEDGTSVNGIQDVKTPNNHTLYAIWDIVLLTVTFESGNTELGTVDIEKIENVEYGTPVNVSHDFRTITVGTDVITATPTSKIGYTTSPVYWTANGIRITTEIPVDSNLNFVVVFNREANTYQITLNANGGSFPNIDGTPTTTQYDATYDSTYGSFPTVSREGHDFKGWFTDASLTTEIISGTKVEITDNSHVYFAKWEIHKFDISFTSSNTVWGTVDTESLIDVNWGTLIEASDETITIGTKNVKVTKNNITGHTVTFEGWFSNGHQISSLTLTGDLSITAKFACGANTYHVTLVLNGTGVILAPTEFDVVYGQSYSSLNEPTYEGHRFDGWYLENSFNTPISKTSQVTTPAHHSLYAKWTINLYTIELQVNDSYLGEIDTTIIENVEHGSIITANSTTLTITRPNTSTNNVNASTRSKTGYTVTFTSWTTGGNNIQENATTLKGNINILASFKSTQNRYTIKFESNGGSSENDMQVLYDDYYGTESTLPFPTKTGYDFRGWYPEPTFSSTRVLDSTLMQTPEDHWLYAQWEIKKFNLDIATNDYSLGNVDNAFITNIPYASTISVENDRIIIVLNDEDSDDENNTELSVSAMPGNIEGYMTMFVCWTTRSGEDFSNLSVSGNVNIIANFTASANEYTVTLDSQGGSPEVFMYPVTYKDPYGGLPLPEKEGHDFVGWYFDQNFTTPVDESSFVEIPGNHTVYAKWEIHLHDITFEINDISLGNMSVLALEDIEWGTSISVNKNTIRIGSNVVTAIPAIMVGYISRVASWTIDGADLVETAQLKKDVVIKANFIKEAKQVTIMFNVKTKDSNGNQLIGTPNLNGESIKVVTFGSAYGNFPIPTLDGYTFDGWFFDPSFKTPVTDTDLVSNEMGHTLYAKWTKITTPVNMIDVAIIIGAVVLAVIIVWIVIVVIRKGKKEDDFDMRI